jgi:hypothetical protein
MSPRFLAIGVALLIAVSGATVISIRNARDPLTPIIQEVILERGDPYGTKLDNLARWFSQDNNRNLAVRVARECADIGSGLGAETAARWSNSTEAKVCRAAVVPASIGVLNHYRAEN